MLMRAVKVLFFKLIFQNFTHIYLNIQNVFKFRRNISRNHATICVTAAALCNVWLNLLWLLQYFLGRQHIVYALPPDCQSNSCVPQPTRTLTRKKGMNLPMMLSVCWCQLWGLSASCRIWQDFYTHARPEGQDQRRAQPVHSRQSNLYA